MNIPPPDLPPPGNLPPPGGLPPPNLPSPNLPPPADQGNERIISQFERAPVETSVAAKVAKQIEEAIAERPLMDAAALKEDAKTYPWRRGRDHLLRTGSLIVLAFGIGQKVPLAGIVLTIIAAVYTGDFLYRVVHSTLEGSDTPPDWPKTSEPVDELIKPGVRITSAFLVGHVVWLFVWLNTDSHVGMNPVAEWISYLVAAVYFPFAMMMIVFQERFAACAPWVSISAMLRCMPASKSALTLSVTAFVAINVLKMVPFVGGLLAAAAGLVLFVMLGRMVGMIAAQHRKALAELH
jgi:hypothetical protein